MIDSNKRWIQFQETSTLFKIRFGIILIQNVEQLVINKCQAVKNMIDIQSMQCEDLQIKKLIIQSHSIFQREIRIQDYYIFKDLGCVAQKNYPNELSITYKARQIDNLVNLNVNTEHPILQDLLFSENTNMNAMVALQNSLNIVIQNYIAIKNDCTLVCFTQIQTKSDQISLRYLQNQNPSLTFLNAQFIQNTGLLIQFVSKSIYFNKTLLIHKDLIYESSYVQKNYVTLQDSEVQYNSDSLLDLTNTLVNNSFIINLKSQSIQTLTGLTIIISFDNGITYYPTQNNKVSFYNNKKQLFDYCNMPTGQSLREYRRLDLKLLSYQPFIKGMIFGLRGSQKLKNSSCSLEYGQKVMSFQFESQNWENFTLHAKPLSRIQFVIICPQVNLSFDTVVLDCQIGEIFINNKCIRCDSSINLYSTQKNSVKCSTKTDLMIEVKSGLIKMVPGVWRPSFTNDQLEICPLQQACLGGWKVGDKICKKGNIGALCQVCDTYDTKGNGRYIANSWSECILCENSYSMIVYIFALLLIQMGMYYINSKSWENDCAYLRGIKLFMKQYQILFKYSVDQFSIFIKIFTGFLQSLLIVTKLSPLLLPSFLKTILYQYSNPSVSIWQQLQCLYTKNYSAEEILDFKPYVVLVLNILLFNSYFFLQFILLIKQKTRYHIRNIMVTIYYIVILNYGNYFELLLSISSWKRISGVDWVNENVSLLFNRKYRQDIQFFIYPQICLLIIIPLVFARILYYKSKDQLLNVKTFYCWGFIYRQFKPENYNQEIQNTYVRLAIVSIAYILNNDRHIRQMLLILLIIWIQKINLINPPFINKQLNSVRQNLYSCLLLEIMLLTMMEQFQNDIQAVSLIQLLMSASLLIVVFLILESFKLSFVRTYSTQIEQVRSYMIQKFPTTSLFLVNKFRLSKSSSINIRSNFSKIKVRQFIKRGEQQPTDSQASILKDAVVTENIQGNIDKLFESDSKLNGLPKIGNSIIIE